MSNEDRPARLAVTGSAISNFMKDVREVMDKHFPNGGAKGRMVILTSAGPLDPYQEYLDDKPEPDGEDPSLVIKRVFADAFHDNTTEWNELHSGRSEDGFPYAVYMAHSDYAPTDQQTVFAVLVACKGDAHMRPETDFFQTQAAAEAYVQSKFSPALRSSSLDAMVSMRKGSTLN